MKINILNMSMRFFVITAFVLMIFSSTPLVANAEPATGQGSQSGGIGTGGGGLVNPLGTKDVKTFLMDILGIVTDIIGPVIVILMLVYVGFLFVTAQGVPGKISAAREMLLWTVVGALILLGAKAIALGIQATVDALKV